MADVAVPVNADAVSSPKGKKSPKKAAEAKKVAKKATHPGTKNMVVAAVKNLKEHKGSSLSSIKKYIATNYTVDSERLAPFVRKAVKSALASGELVQSSGNGASGKFKFPSADKPVKKTAAAKGKKAVAVKPAGKKIAKKGSPKKAVAKKPVAGKPKAVKAKIAPKVKAAPKSPVKKNAKRSSIKKPKTPKPKKTVGRPKGSAKKVAAKK